MNVLLIGGLGPAELVLILVIVLIIFGAGKLPQIGDALGKSIRSFRKASEGREDIDVTPPQSAQVTLPPAAAPAPVAEAEEVKEKASE